MGYGLKKDPDSGETLDLNKTFFNIIKPVVKKLGFECVRCDEVSNSGLIDKVMYEYIWNADLVIADISTLNPNAMYELGVRHALRPSSTVIIAEERTNFSFDVGHNSIFRYKHLGVDIGVTEAKRCIKELTNHIKGILDKNEVDSPFYTYMKYNSLSDLCREEILKEYIYDEAFYNEHMICSLIPKWADTNENDRNLLSRLMNNNPGSFDTNIAKLKEIPSSPLKLRNNHWIYTVNDEIAKNIYPKFTPLMLETFSNIAIEVLSERNSKFDLPKEQRLFANLEGRTSKYSYDVRNGIAYGLVYLSLYKDYLSLNLKQRDVPSMVIYSVLRTNDWKVWGSLDNLLPILAEAAPDAFIKSLKNVLCTSPETFDSLFDQETSGVFGSSLMTGILWGLEVIAWFPGYFGLVIECLAELAKLDKGGNVCNRPINSLETLLLPWINTTTATVVDKMNAARHLADSYPEALWKIIFHLLPNETGYTTGCKEPEFFVQLIKDYNKKVSQEDYIKQIQFYSELTIQLMEQKSERIITVLNNLNGITLEQQQIVFKYLDSLIVSELSAEEKNDLWEQTSCLLREHRKIQNANWSYSEEIINQIQRFNDRLKPNAIISIYKPLFEKGEWDLSDEVYDSSKETDWNKVRAIFRERRRKSLAEIITSNGMLSILNLLNNETIACNVAITLAELNRKEADTVFLPNYLESENKYVQTFVFQYVRARSVIRGYSWLDELNIANWNKSQQINFLINLPFEEDAWIIIKEILQDGYNEYWLHVISIACGNNVDFEEPVLKFLECERIDYAFRCVYFSIMSKRPVKSDLIISVLQRNIQASNPVIESYEIVEVFKLLENLATCNQKQLSELEFAYYPIFQYSYEKLPVSLYKRIQSEPDFYMQLICAIYKREDQNENVELTEQQEGILRISWNILNNFKLLPGLDNHNDFHSDVAVDWIEKVLNLAKENKRVCVTKICLGKLFFYTPRDNSSQLWIEKSIAKLLDKFENQDMRQGFETEAINSRGAHFVDPSGEEEKSIADSWLIKASELESVGFYNFAQTAKVIAKTYNSFASYNYME